MPDKPKTSLRLPPGLSPAEEARWWDDHPEYWDQFDESELEVVNLGPIRRTQRLPYLRLPIDLVDSIKAQAVARETTYQRLIQSWLEERLEDERKSPAKKRAKPQH